jgi:hypothetical protein
MLEQYYNIKHATGVSIHILPSDGDAVINACSVVVHNNRLDIQKKVVDLYRIEGLAEHFPAKLMTAVNISGKGVLQKLTQRIDHVDQNNFSKLLPNASLDDFYVQNFVSGDQSFISAIRKTEADKWISQVEKLGFVPLMLSLGPFSIQNVLPQLNFYDTTIIFNGNTIQRNEQAQWLSCQYSAGAIASFPVKVDSENIDEKLLLAYAAAFQLVLADKLDLVHADVSLLGDEFNKQLQHRKLKVHGSILLGFAFVLLLINFFLFSYLNSANAKLTEQVSRSAQTSNNIQEINAQITQKETLLKTLGWESGVNKSALIDQVASLLPPAITWKEAAIDPVDLSTSRAQKEITFTNRKIRILGNSEKIIPVNEWIARIKSRPWVKNVQLESYTFNSEVNTGQFIITIDY